MQDGPERPGGGPPAGDAAHGGRGPRPGAARRGVDFWPCAWTLVFSPFVLVGLSLAVTDLVQVAASGQPLSSSEGLVGLLMAATLLAMLGWGVARTPQPLLIFAGWASIAAVLQLAPIAVPLVAVRLTWRESAEAMRWCLFPLSVWAIAAGAASAAVLAHRARRCLAPGARVPSPPERVVTENTVISTLLALLADGALLWSAPRDTTAVAARGLAGLSASSAATPAGLIAAGALGAVAVLAYRSSIGAQIAAWGAMIVPSLVIVPFVSTFNGWVAAPGAPLATAVGVSAPVATGLGLMLSGTSMAVHFARGTTLRGATEA